MKKRVREQYHVMLSKDERRKLDRLAESERRSSAEMMRLLIERAPEPARVPS